MEHEPEVSADGTRCRKHAVSLLKMFICERRSQVLLVDFGTMNFKSLEKQALNLPAQERARLAHELLASLDSLSPSEHERLWLDEAERRARQIDAGSG